MTLAALLHKDRSPHSSGAPPSGSSPLSPARAELARLYGELARERARIDALTKPQRDLGIALEAEAEAQAALDAVADLEAGDWRTWTAAPAGTPPGPREREREQAMAVLADCHSRAMAARRAWEAVREQAEAAHERYVALQRQAPDCIRDVLVEEAARLGERFREALRAAAAVEGALLGLKEHFERRHDGGSAVVIAHILRAGRPPADRADMAARAMDIFKEKERQKTISQRNAQRAKAFAAALELDPSVALEPQVDIGDAP